MRGALVLAMIGLLMSATVVSAQGIECAPDQGIPLPDGCLFTITGGDTLDPNDGFAVTNADGVPMWDFVRQRDLQAIGYPISQRWVDGPFTLQAFQKVILQWDPGNGRMNYFNTLDALANDYPGVGLPNVPGHQVLDTSGLSFDEVKEVHLAILDANPKIKAVFLAEADWLNLYGLPIRYEEREVEGNPQGLQMLRAQRAVFEIWNVEAPGTALGHVSLQNLPDKVKSLSNVIIPDAAKAPVTVAGAESLPRFELPVPAPSEPDTEAEAPDIAACATGRAVSNPRANAALVEDCKTLLQVRHAVAGPEGLNWSVDRSIREWEGVVVGGSPLRVIELRLSSRSLRGQIPAELGKLTELRVLDLTQNELTGRIPTELARLTRLRELNLGANDVTGALPAELARLNSLERLNLWENRLTGEIPAELGQLSSLDSLSLNDNRLTGEIPVELSRLTQLKVLSLYNNELTGAIPGELGQLGALSALWLDENNLQGEIPVELGQLTKLTALSLSKNKLTGAIPAELGQLSQLRFLILNQNELTGAIPAELGRLIYLTTLSLERNRLSGEIPPTLGQLSNLTSLLLSENGLTGAIPPELGGLFRLITMSLGHNRLSGEIPPALGRLSNLTGLYLSENRLTGEIPPELAGMTKLIAMSLDHNQLTGEIPRELGELSNLGSLMLSHNRFTGCIPNRVLRITYNDFHLTGLPGC